MQTADLIILTAYLLFLFIIVWRFRRVSASPDEFFLANRSFGALPAGFSVMVTTFSAVNYLALPDEVRRYGLYVIASFPAFFLAAWPAVRYWMPFFRKKKIISIYAFLEERFDLRTRLLASGLFLLWRIFWMGTALYASSRIMSILTGLDFYFVLLLGGAAAALYSALGGMRAVVWTDVLQAVVLFGSILAGTFLACRGNDFSAILAETGKLRPFTPPDPYYFSFDPGIRITFWSALFGSFVTFLTRFGADQMVMQRFLSAKSLKDAQKSLWINGIASTITLSFLAVFGLSLAVHAKRNGLSPTLPGVRIIADFLHTLPAGCTGLIGAGLLAATMSSIDSGLNSCCAAIHTDFQERLALPRISPKLLTIILAIFIMIIAGSVLPSLNKNQTLFVIINKTVNAIGTPLLAIMLCALFRKNVRKNAVFYGTAAGIVLTIIFSFAVKHIALHYYSVLSLLSTLCAITLIHSFRKKKD